MLDPSNVAITSMALGIGLVGAAAIEVIWWVQGRDSRRATQAVAQPSGRVRPMGFLDKVKNLVSKNADKVDTAIDKAGDSSTRRRRASTPSSRQGAGRRQEGRRQDATSADPQ